MKIDKSLLLKYLNSLIIGYTKSMNGYHADSDIYKGYEAVIDEYKHLVGAGTFDVQGESPI